MVVMITGIDLSQEIFAVNMLRTLKSSLKDRRKNVLRSLQLYKHQALAWSPYSRNNHRACLLSCFQDGFKAVNTPIANISCEI